MTKKDSMQKIKDLKTKCVNITTSYEAYAKKEMKQLGVKSFSEYIRTIIKERMNACPKKTA